MGKDIGFLPGTLEEKMEPWLAPIRDNLQYLLGNDKMMVQDYLERGIIEIEALSYIRGSSIANATQWGEGSHAWNCGICMDWG